MDKYQKIKLMKLLPNPDDLVGHMPNMNQPRMVIELLQDNRAKIADITLIALLIATTQMLMTETPDWDEYISPNSSDNDEGKEVDVPEPCGNPECKGCAELEKIIANAPPGTKIKMLRLTREEAEARGLNVDDADARAQVGCDDSAETSKGEIVH
jgi:hypothetical protein